MEKRGFLVILLMLRLLRHHRNVVSSEQIEVCENQVVLSDNWMVFHHYQDTSICPNLLFFCSGNCRLPNFRQTHMLRKTCALHKEQTTLSQSTIWPWTITNFARKRRVETTLPATNWWHGFSTFGEFVLGYYGHYPFGVNLCESKSIPYIYIYTYTHTLCMYKMHLQLQTTGEQQQSHEHW